MFVGSSVSQTYAQGYDFEFTGSGGTATVTGLADSGFSGELIIPQTVVKGGLTYTVTEIAVSAFKGAPITSVSLPPTITVIGGSAFENSSITSVNLPAALSSIGNRAFMSTRLKSVEFYPDQPTKLGGNLFDSTPIETACFGENVTEIGGKAFSNCTSLKSLTLEYNGVVTVPKNAINTIFTTTGTNIPDLTGITLYVPQEMLAQYESSDLWTPLFEKNLKIEAISSGIETITISPQSVALPVGASVELQLTVEPAAAADTVEWTLTPEGIVSFDPASMRVLGVSSGDAVLTATASDGSSATCKVTVLAVNEISLTITDPARGSITVPYTAGRERTIAIAPAGSMKLSSVSLNDEPLDISGGKVTVPALSADSELRIVYSDVATTVDIRAKAVTVTATSGGVRIKGVPTGEQISIYTSAGIEVESRTSDGTPLEIPLPAGSLYLLKAAGTTYRLLR